MRGSILLGFLPLLLTGCIRGVDGMFFEDDIGRDSGAFVEAVPCLPEARVDALEAHLQSGERLLSAGRTAAAPDVAIAWFGLPGLPRTDWFALPLDAACPDASAVDFCTAGLCYAVACDGADGGWRTEVSLDPASPPGPDVLGEATLGDGGVLLTYDALAGVLDATFAADALEWSDGADWSGTGFGQVGNPDSWGVTVLGIHDWGPVSVAISGGVGAAFVESGAVANYSSGELTPAPDCF